MEQEKRKAALNLSLVMGDNALILGHRLSEWCGHGPILEQDIALSNIALDLIGQARLWLSHAGKLQGGKSEDDLAYHRDVFDFHNFQMVETPNGHWGTTLLRQFVYDAWHHAMLQKLVHAQDEDFAGIARKSLKEVNYHLRWSSEWVIRLGDGTEESGAKMQEAYADVWPYVGELLQKDTWLTELEQLIPGFQADEILSLWWKTIREVFSQANLSSEPMDWLYRKGHLGHHTEHLGYILAEMQFLPRAYPDATW